MNTRLNHGSGSQALIQQVSILQATDPCSFSILRVQYTIPPHLAVYRSHINETVKSGNFAVAGKILSAEVQPLVHNDSTAVSAMRLRTFFD